jgi:hypothetical protein
MWSFWKPSKLSHGLCLSPCPASTPQRGCPSVDVLPAHLGDGQRERCVAGVVLDLLAAQLALLLLQVAQLGEHRRAQLQDDLGVDVRHNAQRKHAHARNAAAGQGVDQAQEALLKERRGERHTSKLVSGRGNKSGWMHEEAREPRI